MEFKKLDLSDTTSQDFKSLLRLKVEGYKHAYPLLPAPNESYYHKMLTATERPTHYWDYYLINSDDNTIGYIQLKHNKIKDLNLVGMYFYIDREITSQIMENINDFIIQTVPDTTKIVQTYTTLPAGSDDKLGHLKEMGDISEFMVYAERINVTELNQFDKEQIEKTVSKYRSELKNNGYRIFEVEDGNFRENQDIDYSKFLKSVEEIWNDMPIEDAEWEPEIVTEEIYDAIFKNIAELGGKHYSISIVEESTGEVAGYTDIYYYPTQPKLIHQGDTGVIRSFRGNGFGRRLKYLMLDHFLDNPKYDKPTSWVTENANSNSHMLKINDELGYVHKYTDYVYDIPYEKFLQLHK